MAAPLSQSSSLPTSPSPTPTTPLEISQQLQRVETLHQQVKAEAQRAQEFLTKLRRGELEAQTQAQLQLEQQHRDQDEADGRNPIEEGNGKGVASMCTCSYPHHPLPPTFGHVQRQTVADNRMDYNKNKDSATTPLTLPIRVDEKEVRDLEKRVRGLEGRVRGFEGLPPDREMALLEVERLRRELEGLAKRREGLFEGLDCEDALRLGGGGVADRSKEKTGTSSDGAVSKAAAISRQNVERKNIRASTMTGRNMSRGGRKT